MRGRWACLARTDFSNPTRSLNNFGLATPLAARPQRSILVLGLDLSDRRHLRLDLFQDEAWHTFHELGVPRLEVQQVDLIAPALSCLSPHP